MSSEERRLLAEDSHPWYSDRPCRQTPSVWKERRGQPPLDERLRLRRISLAILVLTAALIGAGLLAGILLMSTSSSHRNTTAAMHHYSRPLHSRPES